jgi:hypothetical protein
MEACCKIDKPTDLLFEHNPECFKPKDGGVCSYQCLLRGKNWSGMQQKHSRLGTGKLCARKYLKGTGVNIIIIIIITPWSRGHLEKLTVPQLVKKLPAFYGTRRFITAFTTARHLSLS